MSVINFPSSTEDVNPEVVDEETAIENETVVNPKSNLSKDNEIYLNGILERMQMECNAIAKTNNQAAICVSNMVSSIVNQIVKCVKDEFAANETLANSVFAGYFIKECIDSATAVISGGVISPITGDEDEWRDVTDPADVGQNLVINYRGTDYNIPIESVQVNVRYPKIYRFNGDNNYAHRLDYFQFHDVGNPSVVHRTEDSLRFIQFPYSMDSMHVQCIIRDNSITDYIEFTPDEISNGLVYPNAANLHPESYIVAPRIPFSMLESAGINLDDEIHKYIDFVMCTHINQEDESDFDFDCEDDSDFDDDDHDSEIYNDD